MTNTNKSVVLFLPHTKFGGSVQVRVELPLSLLSIGTPLDRAGYRVKIIDQRVDVRWRETLQHELLAGPLCLGVTCMTGPQIHGGLEASRMARVRGIPVVWGGIHPTLLPEQTVANENIDIVVQGEGEETFFELVQALAAKQPIDGVMGLWFKAAGTVQHTGRRPPLDLNQQPPLSYHLVDVRPYLVPISGVDHLTIETSRGCQYRCSYCYNTGVYQSTWRGLSADEAIRRIKLLVAELGVKGILFADDNFFGKKERALEILRRIREEKLDVVVSKLDAHSEQFAALTDAEMGVLRGAHCKILMMGIETASPKVLELLNKKLDVPQLLAFNRRLRGSGARPQYFFMMGFPGETEADIAATVELGFRLSAENPEGIGRYNIFTPYPGTPIYEVAVASGLEPATRLEDWVSFNFRTVNRGVVWLSNRQRELIRMLHFATLLAQRNNFIKPYKKTRLWVRALAALYYPVARFRVRHLYAGLPVELKLAELAGVYPRQHSA